MARTCKCGCGKSITHKHPNAKFFNQKHKDKFWNMKNPRGMFVLANSNVERLEDSDPDDGMYWQR